jgi:short-subunit dehydrogenase
MSSPDSTGSHVHAALVTGASSGIGLELSKLLAASKHRLVLAARNMEALERLAGECRQAYGVDVDVVRADLANADGAKDLVTEIDRRGLAIDVLVNNAGFGTHGKFWENDVEEEQALLQVNVVSLMLFTRLLLPGMVSRGRGRVLNIASTAAFQPGPLMANYYASKAYVLSLSEALSNELKGTGVTVTALCPGPTLTNFQKRAGVENSKLFSVAGLTAAQVAKVGYDAMMAGKRVVIPGFKNRLLAGLVRFAPRAALLSVVRKLNESR